MNYLHLILNGWRDTKEKKYLDRYFFKKFKEAERDRFIEIDEFFEGCFKIIEFFEALIAKDSDNNQPICERYINVYNPPLSLSGYPKLYLDHIISLKEALQLAYYKLTNQNYPDGSSETIKLTKSDKILLSHQIKTNPEPETLSDLITHKNSVEIIENVKIQYRNIKGKRLKLLLKAFQDLDLLPKERIAQKFHNCCKIEFDWNIASYNAMNGYNYNEKTDKDELNSMKKYLETLTKQK